jgi:hypothetical protein
MNFGRGSTTEADVAKAPKSGNFDIGSPGESFGGLPDTHRPRIVFGGRHLEGMGGLGAFAPSEFVFIRSQVQSQVSAP